MPLVPENLVRLPENVLLALLLAYAVGQVAERISHRRERAGNVLNGLLFGLATVACMSFPMEPQPGILIDLRSLIVFLAGPFAGPIAAFVAAVLGGGYRMYLGGIGAVGGIGAIVTSAILGALVWKFYGRLSKWPAAALAGLALSITSLPWFLAVGDLETGWILMQRNAPLLAVAYVIGSVAIARLLTSRERRRSMSRELAEDIRRLREIAHVAFDWSWEMDPDLRFTHVTRFGQATYFTPADLVGKRVDELIGGATKRQLHIYGVKLARHEPFRDIVLTVRTDTGEERQLAVSGQPCFDERGTFAGYRGSGRDITDESREYDELLKQASTDWLTGAMNRRSSDALLAAEVERVRRYDRKLSLIVFDIDGFKQVNDQHGHAAGDAVLKGIAETATARLRKNDIFGRLGGDEFLILLPDTDVAGAAAVAEDIRAEVQRCSFAGGLRVTLSLGAAECRPGADATELMNAADGALYEAKGKGKNRVAVARSPDRIPSSVAGAAEAMTDSSVSGG